MKMRTIAGGFLALWAGCNAASAETWAELHGWEKASDVHAWCQPFDALTTSNEAFALAANDKNANFCWGAFAAIESISRYTNNTTHEPLLRICAPPDVHRLQLIQVFDRFVTSRPDIELAEFTPVAYLALLTAYPCPKK